MKSVKSINPVKSMIQTIYDIAKAHGGVPIVIGMKVKTKEGEGLIFTTGIPINN
jgi:uncharacterized protein (DUF1330 family)